MAHYGHSTVTHPAGGHLLLSQAVSNLEPRQLKTQFTHQLLCQEQSSNGASAPRDPQAERGALGPTGSLPRASGSAQPITGSPFQEYMAGVSPSPEPRGGQRTAAAGRTGSVGARGAQQPSSSRNLDPRCGQGPPKKPPPPFLVLTRVPQMHRDDDPRRLLTRASTPKLARGTSPPSWALSPMGPGSVPPAPQPQAPLTRACWRMA